MKKNAYRVIGLSLLLLVVLAAVGIGWGLQSQSFAEDATDLYFKTPGTPQGPAAPSPQETVYPRIGSYDSRLLVWFITQLHTYFGGFVLALPIFCVLLEFIALSSRKPGLALRYDGLARDLAKVALLALSVTAVLGSVMLGIFLYFYPSFMKYMGGTFKAFMPVYAVVFVGESLLLIVYYYTWNRMAEPALKWGHASIGLLANVFGTALLFLANGWSAFMMAPAGVELLEIALDRLVDLGRIEGGVDHFQDGDHVRAFVAQVANLEVVLVHVDDVELVLPDPYPAEAAQLGAGALDELADGVELAGSVVVASLGGRHIVDRSG